MLNDQIKIKILMYFLQDATAPGLYRQLAEYGKYPVQKMFMSMKAVGFITKTNPRTRSAATYATTKAGREHLETLSRTVLKESDLA